MFDNVLARFALRAGLCGIAAAAASLQQALPGINLDEGLNALFAAIIAAVSYAGIGAAIPQVEPNVGRKLD